MQLAPTQGTYIEKVLFDREGRLVKVTFCVYEHGGRIKASVVETVFLGFSLNEHTTPVLCGQTAEKFGLVETSIERCSVSPYFDSHLLYTLGSKPRAPSFKK